MFSAIYGYLYELANSGMGLGFEEVSLKVQRYFWRYTVLSVWGITLPIGRFHLLSALENANAAVGPQLPALSQRF
jgi:hypothetical protein